MNNKFFVGDKVTLLSGESAEKERGIVVHCWYNNELHVFDYYVAFFGQAFPEGKPDRTPYVLRYSESALEKAE
jgi:hypothetical protein